MVFGFRRGDMPEPPPEGWDKLGLRPGYTVKRLPSLDEIDAYCRAHKVSANDAYAAKKIMACVIPSQQQVVLPKAGVLRDPDKEAALQAHEYGHTWDLTHHDGKGWFLRDGKAAPPLTDDLARMVLSMAQPPVRLAAARPKGPTDAGYAIPMKRGR